MLLKNLIKQPNTNTMLQDCNKVHIPSFTETCCLTHTIEMEDYANDHFLSSQYTKFFIKEILTAYKDNKLTLQHTIKTLYPN